MTVPPQGKIRATVADAVNSDDRCVDLVGTEVSLLAEIPTAILRAAMAPEGVSFDSLVGRIVAEFGEPGQGSAADLVAGFVADMAAARVLEAPTDS